MLILKKIKYYIYKLSLLLVCIPFPSGISDLGPSDGARCLTNDDVRGRVDGFVGADAVVEELARTAKQ